MTMRRSCSGIVAGISLMGFLVAGCGHDPFGPPSRPRRAAGTSESEKARSIYYIVPGEPSGDQLTWGGQAQTEANFHQVIFRIMGPAPGETPATQPEVVRKAIADDVSALLVVPGDSPDLPKALAEAESKGIPVVLIGGSVPPPPGAKPFTMVDHAPFEDSARRIVATTVEDLKKIPRPVEGTAMILSTNVLDRSTAKRVEALKSASSAAGFPKVVAKEIDGLNFEAAKATVIAEIQAHPDVAIVLAADSESMQAASQARAEQKGTPSFFLGGYIDFTSKPMMSLFSAESCTFEGRVDELARLGVVTLLKKLDGEPVDAVVYLTPRFNRGSGLLTSPSHIPNKSIVPMDLKSMSPENRLKEGTPPSTNPKPQ